MFWTFHYVLFDFQKGKQNNSFNTETSIFSALEVFWRLLAKFAWIGEGGADGVQEKSI